MIVEILVTSACVLVLVSAFAWWVERIMLSKLEAKQKLIEKFFLEVRQAYDYLTEDIEGR